MWCFNREMLRDAIGAYAEHLADKQCSLEFTEGCCKAAIGFLCSEAARKLRVCDELLAFLVNGEAIEAAPSVEVEEMEVEELNVEEVECRATGI